MKSFDRKQVTELHGVSAAPNKVDESPFGAYSAPLSS